MTKTIDRHVRDGRAELQAWYLERLRPKLADAVRAGKVDPAPAANLERLVSNFLDLPNDPVDEAA